MSDNDLGPTFTFPEITAAPPGGYQRDKRFKLGEAGEKFIQRHIPQARKLVETFSNPPTTVNRLQYGAFKAEKFAQWKSNGLAADADTHAKFERKWNNIRNQFVSRGRSSTIADSTPGEASLLPPLHLASTVNGITARSIFNEEHSEAHKAAVICDRRTNDEGPKQHVGRLAALRAAEWHSLTPAEQAQYHAKAEAERQRIYGDVEACQTALLDTIEKVLTAAVGISPGQVGRAGFAFQYMFNTKDGKRKCGGMGFGECDRFAETPEFKNTLMPIFKQFANDHVTLPSMEQGNDPYEGVSAPNELGHYLLPEIEDDELFSEYRTKLKLFLTAYWNSMFPTPHQLSTIPWADIYRSPTSFFVDSVIPAGSPSMDSIENMKCSSMIKLADRIRLVQQSDRPNIFRAKADILRSSPSEAVAPKTQNMGVTIIDVDALPSTPSPPQFDSSGELPSIAPESPLALVRTSSIKSSMFPADVLVDIIEPSRASGPSNAPHSSAKRKSNLFSDNAGAAAFTNGTRSPKKPRLSRAPNGTACDTTPKS